ncbi:hypothetical protein FA15DRAFT_593029 [Coprinopsis marcescibilis]|uniref:Uncharacterized protein n=1 Tax=Coprinopsis marcescibilis TaxID=230819 RepID=A0A5C3KV92_COPMA|nr:hypothetical protein FA15DRAFT_593029 [Coprinopsis marcescibilis]
MSSRTASIKPVDLASLPRQRPDLSYAHCPTSTKFNFFWRWRMWLECTFALTVMETWERWLVLTLYMILFGLVMMFLILMPYKLWSLKGRVVYYIWGQEGEERLLRHVLSMATPTEKS